MSSKLTLKGKLGVHLALIELLKRDIDVMPTPYFWPFDLITKVGLKLEVKYSNLGENVGGSGYRSERFTFRISPIEIKLIDYLILVLNTHSGYFFYVIPKDEVTSRTIGFNPFSDKKSKYEKYLNRWEPLKTIQNKILNYDEIPNKTKILQRINKLKKES